MMRKATELSILSQACDIEIYGKLGVKKRAEAVDRAHELGILG